MTGLMAQGLQLMLLGMGTVFVFLTLLVFATGLMSRIANRIAPPAVPQSGRPAAIDGPGEEEVAAITAAIAAHRKNHH